MMPHEIHPTGLNIHVSGNEVLDFARVGLKMNNYVTRDGSPPFLLPVSSVPTSSAGALGGARLHVKTKVPGRCRYVCVGLSRIIPAHTMPTLGGLISLPLS